MTAFSTKPRVAILNITYWMIAGLIATLTLSACETYGDDSNTTVRVNHSKPTNSEHGPASRTETLPRSIDREFHPEAAIGPPIGDRLLRTAVRPEAGLSGSFNTRPSLRPEDLSPRDGGWDNQWTPSPVKWQTPSNPANEDSHQTKISSRAQNPQMAAYLARASFNQIASLFGEASRLIDTRHVSPPSYEKRTADALMGLAEAVGNPEFLAANRVSPSEGAVRNLQQELTQMAQMQPARSSSEAIGLMQWAAELSQQRIGIRREAVALEFLNSTIDSLDKHSAFLPAKSQSAPSASLEERIVGIGVELKTAPEGVLVTGVIEGGPAAGAGLKKGDLIVAIDGRKIAGMGLSQAADYIGGPSGSTVRLTIARQGQTMNASMQRRQVYVSSVVDTKFLDSQRKIGYVRLKQFSESTSQDLMKEMWNLYNAGMDSLVLDLRGNPGGLLSQAVDVSDIFVPSGMIVETRGRTSSDNSDFQAKRANTWKIPLVVLIDDHSASASEIFAAAIQENGRGVIVGRQSYGKGTVQTHFPLQSASGELKLTTAKFFSPTGREMAGVGVTPDYTVPVAPGAMEVDETRDPDLIAAVRVIQTGRPAELADAAGRSNRQQLGLNSGR
jgi:carboxyl-terminal processing protease